MLRQQNTREFPYALVSLLLSIHRSQPVSIGQLAAQEGISPPSVTRTLKRLFEMGLVSREYAPGDRRSITIRLTRLGQAKRLELLQEREVWLTAHISHLTDEEVAEVIDTLPILDKLSAPGAALPTARRSNRARVTVSTK